MLLAEPPPLNRLGVLDAPNAGVLAPPNKLGVELPPNNGVLLPKSGALPVVDYRIDLYHCQGVT